jgi:hypothetical protein
LGLLSLCLLSGCTGASSLVLGAGAGTATGSGVAYTMDSIAYKTFTAPLDAVAEATRSTLKSMAFPVRWESQNTSGVDIMAKAGNPSETLDIEIDLERLSPQVTRMRIVANRGFFEGRRDRNGDHPAGLKATGRAGASRRPGPGSGGPGVRSPGQTVMDAMP